MNTPVKWIVASVAGVLALAGLYVYRTLELGRGDAQPAFLEHLNPGGEFLGPEGICLDSRDNLLVGDARGLIWNLGRGGKPSPFSSFFPGQESAESSSAAGRTAGLAADHRGYIYASFRGPSGGRLIQFDSARSPKVIAGDIGEAGALAVTQDDKSLWAADCSSAGRVLRYPLGAAPPIQPDFIVQGLHHPAGLALGKDDRMLYVSEMYSGDIVEIDLAEGKSSTKRIADLKGRFSLGSLTSLAFDPRDLEHRFLYAGENLRGMIAVIDVKSRPVRVVKHLRLTLMGGRLCPGGIVIRDGYLYFTDLWTCNPPRLALGIPKWQGHAFRFRVTDLASLYPTGRVSGR